MQDKNELNDIVLNKGASSANTKKVILSVATLGVILIIIIVIMNSMSPRGTQNLPQPTPPPQVVKQSSNTQIQEPLFEEVSVEEETPNKQGSSLDEIAQRLKQESAKEQVTQKEIATPKSEVVLKEIAKEVSKPKPKVIETKKEPVVTSSTKGGYYIQIGSFEKKEPSKNLLSAVSALGHKYVIHEVVVNDKKINKLLVGPFSSELEARKALPEIRSSVEKNAFLTKL